MHIMEEVSKVFHALVIFNDVLEFIECFLVDL